MPLKLTGQGMAIWGPRKTKRPKKREPWICPKCSTAVLTGSPAVAHREKCK